MMPVPELVHLRLFMGKPKATEMTQRGPSSQVLANPKIARQVTWPGGANPSGSLSLIGLPPTYA
jgi:hypothetical protein